MTILSEHPIAGQPRMPRVALWLGATGALPFIALSLAVVFDVGPSSADGSRALWFVLAVYGALIASFLGGIRWGIALGVRDGGDQARLLVTSVVPALIVWPALLLLREHALAAIGITIAVLGVFDARLPAQGLAPAWFARLRIVLSTVAAFSLLTAWAAMLVRSGA